jgi:hypothetical protein
MCNCATKMKNTTVERNAGLTKGFLFSIQNEHAVSDHKQKCNSTSSRKKSETGLEAIFAKPTNDQQLVCRPL